jgi:PAS domain S-box-containing protein
MVSDDRVNVLLVDDQPAKLLSYEVVLQELGETVIKAGSAREAMEHLLRTDVAVVLMDVSMPDLDGFELAAMIRDHPRFRHIAIIFVSAIHLTERDFKRGYEMGAVDYVPVPVIPEVLRAKVKVFAELHRKTRQLEQLTRDLERRVAERTAALEAAAARLRESDERRDLALAAGRMGSWDWDLTRADCQWDDGQYRIFGVERRDFPMTLESVRALIEPQDWAALEADFRALLLAPRAYQAEFRVRRPDGEPRWCLGTAAPSLDDAGRVVRISGVTIDITERKQAEERQALLAREVDHRAKNALALVQSIVRLSRAQTTEAYVQAVEGRIGALSRAHTLLAQSRWQGVDLAGLLEEELAAYRHDEAAKIVIAGPHVTLDPRIAQTLALALHELATNAVKYGALSGDGGRVSATWEKTDEELELTWVETGGPPAQTPATAGFGLRLVAASIQHQLGGRSTFDWRPEGLRCVVCVPMAHAAGTGSDGRAIHPPAPSRPLSKGSRIMLVEDEVIVGMMMRDFLDEIGCVVSGPLHSVSEALPVAERAELDFAILDVNLGRETVYPVAELLSARKIPFLFLTGYGPESIDRRFSGVRILQKPVDRETLRQLVAVAPRRDDPPQPVLARSGRLAAADIA